MRIVIIAPYRNSRIQGSFVLDETLAIARQKGQLEGVEIDVDPGHPIESPSETRDEEFLATIAVGFIKKVKEYSQAGKHDAIVSTGGFDPGFMAARSVSKIPVAASLHSAVHMASLIGERFSVIDPAAESSLIIKRCVHAYGLGHKLASVRFFDVSSTEIFGFVRSYKKEERFNKQEVKRMLSAVVGQCVAAIEQERADSLVVVCGALQPFEPELRQVLDEAGYPEIPIVWGASSALAMAKAMVNAKVVQAARAYPGKVLKAKPAYW